MLSSRNKSVKYIQNNLLLIGTIGTFIASGMFFVFMTRAVTPAVSTQPELGVLANGATAASDTTASGGKYVKFAVPVTPPAAPPPAPGTSVAATWIASEFKGITAKTGTASGRQNVETPAYFKDYTVTGGKYGIDAHEKAAPVDKRIALVNVKINANSSTDIYGASLYNAKTTAGSGIKWFLKNVTVDPNWPKWVSYTETNYDGITLDNLTDGDTQMYAEDLTVSRFNADAGVDNKTQKSQFVRLTITGTGHRSMRIWRPGPHYLVDSRIDNPGGLGDGAIFWMSNCSTTILRVWNSSFNGSKTVPSNKIKCDSGSPNITYLTKDPRTTGEMHPMFGKN